MPELVLTSLKFLFLALLYLFVARAIRVIWLDLAGPRAAARLPEGAVPRPRPAAGLGRTGANRGARPKSLVVIEEGAPPRSLALGADAVTLGRADDCTVPLQDQYVSQLHTKIFPKDGAWYVTDLGSTNGTTLNHVRVSDPMPVVAGDVVKLGTTVVEVRAK